MIVLLGFIPLLVAEMCEDWNSYCDGPCIGDVCCPANSEICGQGCCDLSYSYCYTDTNECKSHSTGELLALEAPVLSIELGAVHTCSASLYVLGNELRMLIRHLNFGFYLRIFDQLAFLVTYIPYLVANCDKILF